MIDNLYHELRNRKLTRSLRHFSEAYMCRASNYAVDLKRSSVETLTFLHTNLMKAGQDDLALQILLMIFDQAQDEVSKRVRRAR